MKKLRRPRGATGKQGGRGPEFYLIAFQWGRQSFHPVAEADWKPQGSLSLGKDFIYFEITTDTSYEDSTMGRKLWP